MHILKHRDTTKEQIQSELNRVLKLDTKRLLSYYKKHREIHFRNRLHLEYDDDLFNPNINYFFKSIREELDRREHIEH